VILYVKLNFSVFLDILPVIGGLTLTTFKRIIHIPLKTRKSFFLFGPRGTGKTTWLRQHLPEALFFNLLQSEPYNRLSANPGLIREMIPPHYSDWIIIDEIQRIPEMLNEVHDLIESQKHIFILTGSSARKLRQKGINLLTGRALTVLPIEQALRDLKQLLRPL
jgi:predicted AAA+ superfamily ATPase